MTLLDPFHAALLCLEIARSSVNPLLNAVLDGLQLPFHFEASTGPRVKSQLPDVSWNFVPPNFDVLSIDLQRWLLYMDLTHGSETRIPWIPIVDSLNKNNKIIKLDCWKASFIHRIIADVGLVGLQVTALIVNPHLGIAVTTVLSAWWHGKLKSYLFELLWFRSPHKS